MPTGNASGFGTLSTTSPEHYPADALHDCLGVLRPGYRANAVWLMNSSTLSTVRKFKNADGDYIVRDSMRVGDPPMRLGHEIVLDEQMPAIASNAHPVLLGDFRQAYMLGRIGGMSIIRDDVTTKGHTLFYVAQRYAGNLVNPDALKAVKCASS